MKCKSVLKHSPLLKKIRSKYALFILIAGFIFAATSPLQAQMFSVGDSAPEFSRPTNEIYIGLQPIDMNFEGGSVQPAAAADVFAFSGNIIRLGYEGRSVDLSLGTGGEITGINDNSYFDIGGNIDFGLPLYRSESVSLYIPFRIASRYTNVTSNQALGIQGLNRFQFGSLTLGAGGRVEIRPSENIRIHLGALPGYGFAFASGGFFGGSLSRVDGFGRLYLDQLFGDFGLSVGYVYDLRNYDIDEDVFDYEISGHSIELGITF